METTTYHQIGYTAMVNEQYKKASQERSDHVSQEQFNELKNAIV